MDQERSNVAYWPIAPFRTYALNGRFRGEADVDRSSPLANRDANDPTETNAVADVAAQFAAKSPKFGNRVPVTDQLHEPARKGNAIDRLRETAIINGLLVTLAEQLRRVGNRILH